MKPGATETTILEIFKAATALGSRLFEKRRRSTTHTTLNGVVVELEVARRNIEKTAAGVAINFASPRARFDVLNDALQAFRASTRRFDVKFEIFAEKYFKEGWEQLELAAGSSSESRCERCLERAEDAFVEAYSRLKNERLIAARYGAALAQHCLGELTNGLATLEKIALVSFDASAPNSDYWNFLRMKLETRDYLATLGSQPSLEDYWREQTERFKELAFSGPNPDAEAQAFRLAQATRLLSSDLKAGAAALKAAARGVNKMLNAEAAMVCETTFGEGLDALIPAGNVWRANPQAGTRQTLSVNGCELAFVYCPPETFWMGSPTSEAGREDDETPRMVTLTRGFWTLETPVTQGLYRAIVGGNPSHFRLGDHFPVEGVSWYDCQAFLETLTALKVAPEGLIFRLPTEAEWEFACRAGTSTPFSWGSTLNGDKANCDGSYPYGGVSAGPYLQRTTATRAYPPNAWGLYDMHGNVWEWCADWHGPYDVLSRINPTGPESGTSRVLRGGSWRNGAMGCRAASRNFNAPTGRYVNFGFRFVLASER